MLFSYFLNLILNKKKVIILIISTVVIDVVVVFIIISYVVMRLCYYIIYIYINIFSNELNVILFIFDSIYRIKKE
jgi:hypothetical protein